MVFDMDHTILSENTDERVLELLKDSTLDEVMAKINKMNNWAHSMQVVFDAMQAENVKVSEIERVVKEIDLNPGFREVFNHLEANRDKFDMVLMTGGNTIYVEWVLEQHKLKNLVQHVYCNISHIVDNTYVKIRPYHVHSCDRCDKAQCKKEMFTEHLQKLEDSDKYKRLVFVGDGPNDYCASLVLRENDVLFPRKNYPLYNMLYNQGLIKTLKCDIIPWADGKVILDTISKFN